jgi:hypothetical protein
MQKICTGEDLYWRRFVLEKICTGEDLYWRRSSEEVFLGICTGEFTVTEDFF